jgi:prepilin-type N-terminal cleavage/methylation domain-containing protein
MAPAGTRAAARDRDQRGLESERRTSLGEILSAKLRSPARAATAGITPDPRARDPDAARISWRPTRQRRKNPIHTRTRTPQFIEREPDAIQYGFHKPMPTRSSQAGFTLLEVTVTCAVIGILAAVALPTFASSTNDSKLKTEVNSMFGELKLREEAYMAGAGGYLATGSTEQETFPTTPSHTAQTLGTMPDTWRRLKVRLPEAAACAYVVIAGGPQDAGTVGTRAATSFGFAAPPGNRNWFYAMARCYDGDRDMYFFSSYDDATLRMLEDVVR